MTEQQTRLAIQRLEACRALVVWPELRAEMTRRIRELRRRLERRAA